MASTQPHMEFQTLLLPLMSRANKNLLVHTKLGMGSHEAIQNLAKELGKTVQVVGLNELGDHLFVWAQVTESDPNLVIVIDDLTKLSPLQMHRLKTLVDFKLLPGQLICLVYQKEEYTSQNTEFSAFSQRFIILENV